MLPSEFLGDALGGKLDRCERILDLMRDAAGRLVPRRELLRLYELRGVLERRHPPRLARATQARDGNLEIAQLAAADQRDLARAHAARGQLAQRVEQRREIAHQHIGQAGPHARLLDLQHLLRRAVD